MPSYYLKKENKDVLYYVRKYVMNIALFTLNIFYDNLLHMLYSQYLNSLFWVRPRKLGGEGISIHGFEDHTGTQEK